MSMRWRIPGKSPKGIRIAVVDDEPIIRETLGAYLRNEGIQVFDAESVDTLVRLLDRQTFDLILLDIRLPDGDGLILMQQIHAETDVPVILVTSKSEEVDRVMGLELGADDYITKPFSPRELLARVNTVLRPTANIPGGREPTGARRFAGWSLDVGDRRLTSPDGDPVRLTHAEFDLLAALVCHPGRVMSRDELIGAIGGHEWNPNDRTIDVIVSRIRRKIEPDPSKPSMIQTEYGIGYVFAEPVT
ncbi:response regulator [Aliiruegeria lutimaris]|uniref:Regulatory protein VirG n=1 Tax=Aliiruegeria lutimaris TaxID=571298 RepID=A0A1G8S1S2_9RHOB|nr:response regulator transcription factor [Aliiruegeria lutimaris]SDJ23187.1 two component transcriptional regulator, winged helix family [Aliiruegeria lutimaris]